MNTDKPIALITGASRRLGLHMTASLLQAGWHVIAFTRNPSEELLRLQCQRLDVISCDPLSRASCENAIATVKSRYHTLHFLLHNASIYEKDNDHRADVDQFYDGLYQIHMKLPARLNHELSGLLQMADNANIIHITDIYVNKPNPEYALYCSTKAGAENLMLSFAQKLAPRVRVNAIQPGPVKFLPSHSSENKEQVLKQTLLAEEGGFGAVEKAIYAILDNHYMTASVVRVDGGRSMA